MTLEGIVIQIIPQKERDLIARMLLREGTITSVYVYGGMGGGKNSKPRVYEPGNLLRIQLRESRSGHTSLETLQMASEQSLLWQSQHIRHHPQAFALACLYLEMVLKTALPHSSENIFAAQEHGGLFNVVSNGLFHLDQALMQNNFKWENHLLLFLSKFLLHLGILPDESECVYCGCQLEEEVMSPLIVEQGGYSCMNCVHESGAEANLELPVRALLSQAIRTRFQDWSSIQSAPQAVNTHLIHFWCYHFQVKLPDVTSYKMLF